MGSSISGSPSVPSVSPVIDMDGEAVFSFVVPDSIAGPEYRLPVNLEETRAFGPTTTDGSTVLSGRSTHPLDDRWTHC